MQLYIFGMLFIYSRNPKRSEKGSHYQIIYRREKTTIISYKAPNEIALSTTETIFFSKP